jgi:hypothetical protein
MISASCCRKVLATYKRELDLFPEAIPRTIVRIASTPTLLLIGCSSDVDGRSTVTLGPEPQVAATDHLILDGMLDTPHRNVAVVTILLEKHHRCTGNEHSYPH